MAAFVLAHLSDPHLAPLPAPRPLELLNKRITGYINWKRKRAAFHQRTVLDTLMADLQSQRRDHSVLTGDVVNLALPDEFSNATSWLQGIADPADLTLIPGNHDAYVAAGLPQAQAAWEAYMRGDETVAGRPPFPFVRRRRAVSIIALSSAVPTPWFHATGALGIAQITALAGLLAAEKARGAFRVVLVHHPVRTEDAHHFKRLIDADDFQKVIAAHGAELILHGHNHRNMHSRLPTMDGHADIVGVSSASAINDGRHDPASYNLFEIDGTPGAWRCTMIRRGFADATPGPVTELSRTVLR